MYVDMNDKNIIDLNSIVNDLKSLLDSIYDKFSSIRLNETSLDDLVTSYSNDNEFINKLNLIIKLSDDIAETLEGLELFQEEFFFYLSIRNMINYILRNIKYYILYSSFVHDLSVLFCNLIKIKITHLRNSTLNDYTNEFELFKKFYFEKKEFFYSNIYICSHEYDELVGEVTEIFR